MRPQRSIEEFKPMAFEVPPLPYEYDALEPHIDEATMRVHHDKHHQAYVDNANKALAGTDLEKSAKIGTAAWEPERLRPRLSS